VWTRSTRLVNEKCLVAEQSSSCVISVRVFVCQFLQFKAVKVTIVVFVV
jgi:hypothetical protein